MYIVYNPDIKNGRTEVFAVYPSVWPELIEMNPNGFEADSVPQPENRPGFEARLMAIMPEGEEDEYFLYYEYLLIVSPETEWEKVRRRVADLEELITPKKEEQA